MQEIFRLTLGVAILTLMVFTVNVSFANMDISELSRAEALLQRLEAEKNLYFIRNGAEYTACETAIQLRLKLQHFKTKVATVEEFINEVGGKTTITGDTYLLRAKYSKNITDATPYLLELLQSIDLDRS